VALRRAGSVSVERHNNWLGRLSEVEVRASRSISFRLDRASWLALEASEEPVAVGEDGARTLWHTADGWYWEDDGLEAEAVSLLVWDRLRRRDGQLERLRRIRAREEHVADARRERIPPEVRAFVWERDDGRCVRCGAADDLQFDHLIPVSRGGGNAAVNLQVLCGPCNRLKADHIQEPDAPAD
jgi:hypothetical protein